MSTRPWEAKMMGDHRRIDLMKERIEADEALMRTGLQSLEDSIDIVRHEYLTDWRHGIPTRKAQLAGIKEIFDRHEAAITALRNRLESSNGL